MKKGQWGIGAAVLLMMSAFLSGGCAGGHNAGTSGKSDTEQNTNTDSNTDAEQGMDEKDTDMPEESGLANAAPEMSEEDWSAYFDGLNGCAVLYDPAGQQYRIYGGESAMERRSPCSTFKIVSSLIALEGGFVVPERSVRTWSGEIFWNENWNCDLDFDKAFRESCVWYFREVTDEIGAEHMQEELNRLDYGNCDISDWEGRLNTNNNNRSLTGFWIESSLMISPKEQTEVMERIFGRDSIYSEETRDHLRRVMLTEQDDPEVMIYGKTGMGKAHGIVVDAWFAGFAEKEGRTVYFCIWLGQTDNRNVSSAAAREIAIRILSDQF